MRITASDIVAAIGKLSRSRDYNYINPSTTTKVYIDRIVYPEGPIYIRRYDPTAGQSRANAKTSTISVNAVWRVANAIREGVPFNLDRVFGGSYNNRSALETLIANTPQFYYCYPGRIQLDTSTSSIERGHKHLIFKPNDPHPAETLHKLETPMDLVISEIPVVETVYEALIVPDDRSDEGLEIDVVRRHAEIQIALVHIGPQLGYRTWVAQNDRGISFMDRPLGDLDGVIARLEDELMLQAFDRARTAATFIDVIWFKNGTLMPAVIEVEHSTGVKSGLTRMKGLFDEIPRYPTRWVVSAADEDRDLVMKSAAAPQFHDLQTRFFPYSAVEELWNLCRRRKIHGVTEEFLDCYMEPCVSQ